MKSLKLLFAICVWLSFVTVSDAQWDKLKGPHGYQYNSCFIDKKGNIFINSNTEIYFSEDRGQSWIKTILKYNSHFFDFECRYTELKDHQILLIFNGNSYKFNFMTKTWEMFLQTFYPYMLLSIEEDGRHWYLNNEHKNGLFMTKDTGKTFQYLETPYPIDSCKRVTVKSYKDEFILLNTKCGTISNYYKSTGGSTFIELAPTIPTPLLFINQSTSTVFTLNINNQLCRSTDQGETFVKINGMVNLSPNYSQISLIPNGDICLISSGAYYYSSDDGLNWVGYKEYTKGNYPCLEPNSITFLTNDTLICSSSECDHEGIYISDNGGKNWKLRNGTCNIPFIKKLVEDHDNILYAFTCSDTTSFISKDNGISWNRILINYNGHYYGIKDIAINDNGDLIAASKSAVFKSSNKGVDFMNLKVPDKSFSIWPITGVYLGKNNYIYVFSDAYQLLSKNGGSSWKNISFSIPKNNLDKYVQLNNKGDLYCIEDAILFKYNQEIDKLEISVNTGEFQILSFTITQNGFIYFIARDIGKPEYNLWISKDDLKSFKKIENIPPYLENGIFSDVNSNVYIRTRKGIYFSSNHGETFNFLTNIPVNTSRFYLSSSMHLYGFWEFASEFIFRFSNLLASGNLAEGKIFVDSNDNCNLELNKLFKPLTKILVSGPTSKDYITYGNNESEFNFRLEKGDYNITTIPESPLWKSCPPISFNVFENIEDTIHLDLGLKPKKLCPYLSLQLEAPTLRRCSNNKIYIRYCNIGTSTATNVTLTVSLPDQLSFISSSYSNYNKTGQEIKYNLSDLQSNFCGDIVIEVKLSCSSENDELVCLRAQIEPNELCSDDLPNISISEKCNKAVGSFDPNDKTAYINGKPADGHTDMNQDVEYLIRFQNTGTDTAFRVVVVDDIPEGFDLLSLKPLNSSHPFNIEIENPRRVKFIFDPIMLPDSNINEEASHGFVAFKISPDKDLPYGKKLDNTANIYFDFNTPVATNTAYLTVAKATSTSSQNDNLEFSYYPNPTKGELNIQVPNSKSSSYKLKITDLLGKEIQEEKWNGNNYRLKTNSLMNHGLYFISVEDSEGRHGYGKFVVK